MGVIWDRPSGSDRAEKRGCFMIVLGLLLAVVAMLLALGSVIENWIRDAQLLDR